MASAKTRIFHLTLPECASSFRSHEGCPGSHNATGIGHQITCNCVPCHGESAKPESLCITCGSSIPYKVNEHKIEPWGFTSRSEVRVCDPCRDEFVAEYLPKAPPKRVISLRGILAVLLALTISLPIRAADWDRYESPEWSLPKGLVTERGLQRHETARKWFVFAGTALLVGAVIANKNADGLSAKASGMSIPMSTMSTSTPGGGTMFYFVADPRAMENQGRVRSKAMAYRTGAAIGAVMASICLTVGLSLRF